MAPPNTPQRGNARKTGDLLMPKAFTPKVVTANALLEGDVIYLAADDR